MLYRNREKGGAGKLRSFWDNRVFVVTHREEDVPVYSIKPEKGGGAVKRVHRNDIMACNEILSDEEAEKIATTRRKQKEKVPGTKKVVRDSQLSRHTARNSATEREVAVDSEESEEEVLVLEHETSAVSQAVDESEAVEESEAAEDSEMDCPDMKVNVPQKYTHMFHEWRIGAYTYTHKSRIRMFTLTRIAC